MFGGAKDMVGQGKDMFGAGKDMVGQGKDMFGKGKDMFGGAKDMVGQGKDLMGAGNALLGKFTGSPGEQLEQAKTEIATLTDLLLVSRSHMNEKDNEIEMLRKELEALRTGGTSSNNVGYY